MEFWECGSHLGLLHSQEREADSDLPGLQGSTESHDELCLPRHGGQVVVESTHLVLLVVAIETVDLGGDNTRPLITSSQSSSTALPHNIKAVCSCTCVIHVVQTLKSLTGC